MNKENHQKQIVLQGSFTDTQEPVNFDSQKQSAWEEIIDAYDFRKEIKVTITQNTIKHSGHYGWEVEYKGIKGTNRSEYPELMDEFDWSTGIVKNTYGKEYEVCVVEIDEEKHTFTCSLSWTYDILILHGVPVIKKSPKSVTVYSSVLQGFCEIEKLTNKNDNITLEKIDLGDLINVSFHYTWPGFCCSAELCTDITGNTLSQKSLLISPPSTEIQDEQFNNETIIETVTIPDGVQRIGDHAFANCISLKEIFIPDSVTEIGLGAFSDCISLVSIHLPNSVCKIGASAFTGCINLKNINIPENILNIDRCTFAGCESLEEVTLPINIQDIGEEAFASCFSLKILDGGSASLRIHRRAFAYCTQQIKICVKEAHS